MSFSQMALEENDGKPKKKGKIEKEKKNNPKLRIFNFFNFWRNANKNHSVIPLYTH